MKSKINNKNRALPLLFMVVMFGSISSAFTQNDVQVGPLITTKWGLDSPYNDSCPGNFQAGCVAIAMSQIVKYHAHPARGTGTTPAYYTRSRNIYMPPVNLEVDYHFNEMGDAKPLTATEKANVARLIYHCGVSIEMDYGVGSSSGSGAFSEEVPVALSTYFGYGNSLFIFQETSNIDWDATLRRELDAGRPVYYAGYSVNSNGEATSGHAFVCDGYRKNNYFHINWGVTGWTDGWYLTTAFPMYKSMHEIIINIRPDDGVQPRLIGASVPHDVVAILKNDTLMINGIGDMKNFHSDSWDSIQSVVTTIIIGDGVTNIGNQAFCRFDNLTSVTIPNSVTTIGNSAFAVCSNLTSITIPNSVKTIGFGAFSSSGLTSVTIPNSVITIGDQAFARCSSLTSVTILNGVTTIEDRAFTGCSGLTSVTIPNSVKTIGISAFSNCSGLTSVTIPDSITEINNYTFYNCSGLTSVTIPKSVTTIGDEAFSNCIGLTYITSKATIPPVLGSNAFNYVPAYTPIYIPCQSYDLYSTDSGWSRFINYVNSLTDTTYYAIEREHDDVPYTDDNFTNLTQTGDYYRTFNIGTDCDSVVCLTFTVKAVVSTLNMAKADGDSSSLQAYPTPTSNLLQVTNYGLQATEYNIYNVMGQKVMQGELSSSGVSTINVESLDTGIYYLKVGNKTVKILKIR